MTIVIGENKLSVKITADDFAKWIESNRPDIILLEDYKGSKEKIKCQCTACGFEWPVSPNSLKRGRGCAKCAEKSRTQHNLSRGKRAFMEAMSQRTDITVLGEYTGNKNRIIVRCNNCYYEWMPTPNNLKHGSGCPKCSKVYSPSNDEFLEWMKNNRPEIIPLTSYVTSSSDMICRCLACGHEWKTRPNTIKNGMGCPRCARSQTSFAEQYIKSAIEMVVGVGNVCSRNRSALGKEIDIYIEKYFVGIEYGSWYWHAKRIQQDKEKRELAERRGIKLITIYDAFDGNEEPFDGCIAFPFHLGERNHRDDLNRVIDFCLNEMELEYTFSKADYINIENQALRNARRVDTDSFKKELKHINPNIEVLGEYYNASTPIHVRCRQCGFEWNSRSVYLKQGNGCKKCAGVYSPTSDEFAAWIRIHRKDIELLEPYTNLKKKVLCKCKNCKHKWRVVPDSLKVGKRCPKCVGNYSPATSEFIAWMEKNRPEILVQGEYINTHAHIECKCLVCGTVWSPRPHDLKRGSGCPTCANNKKRGPRRVKK